MQLSGHTQYLVGARIDPNVGAQFASVKARYVAGLLMEAHKVMDLRDFSERGLDHAFDAWRVLCRNGDLDERAEKRPTAAQAT